MVFNDRPNITSRSLRPRFHNSAVLSYLCQYFSRLEYFLGLLFVLTLKLISLPLAVIVKTKLALVQVKFPQFALYRLVAIQVLFFVLPCKLGVDFDFISFRVFAF